MSWTKRLLLGLGLAALPATSAQAWDPSRTHVGITERAVGKSEVHSRWMEASARQRGWFTPLRIDPKTLDPEVRRQLVVAMRRAHADVGSIAGGGPGACPPLPAPAETRHRCVDGDAWETTALGWVRIGIALEVSARDRLLHHFVDGKDPGKPRWQVRGAGKGRWRRVERRAGGPLAAKVGRSGFGGEGTSAIGWLDDRRDPFAPPALHGHLVGAALAERASERERQLALAMVGVGALLHVVQDLTMPAHARGDLAGMMVPLSPQRGDRGSPLAEAARLAFGRAALPDPIALAARKDEAGVAHDLHALLLGDGQREGIIAFAGRRFLSDGSLPPPRVIEEELDAAAAAQLLLGEDRAGLLEVEVEGAVLAPWPADAGYLRNGAGRALAAFARDDDGVVRLYLDRHVLRQQALALLPVAVSASERVLDVLFPAWPESTWDEASDVLEIEADPRLHDPELVVAIERPDGTRTVHRRVRLLDQRSRIRDVTPASLPESATMVLVLRAKRDDGMPIVIERRLDAEVPEPPAEAPPTEAPPTEATPTEATPTEATPTEPTPAELPPLEEAPPTDAPPAEAPPAKAIATPPTKPTTTRPPAEPSE